MTIPDAAIEAAAEASHDAYEDAALRNGWETQERSRKPRADVPEENKATVREAIRAALDAAEPFRQAIALPPMSDDAKARRDLWRECAEKGIEQGLDWPRIVLTLFRDIDQLRSIVRGGTP